MFTIEVRSNTLKMPNDGKLSMMNWIYPQRPKQRDRIKTQNEGKRHPEHLAILKDVMPFQNEIMSSYATPMTNSRVDSFHKAMGPVLVVGQLFGLMPVCGVLGENASCLRYVFLSWRVFYALLCIIGSCMFTCLCIARLFTSGIKIQTVSSAVFYVSTFLTSIFFYRLSRHWPSLCQAIENEENRSASNTITNQRTRLCAKLRLLSFFFLFTAIAEHISCILSVSASVYGCSHDNSFLVGYFTSNYPQVFSYTEYDHWKAVLLQIHYTFASFHSNYIDLFIILMSIHLSMRFDVLNSSIKAAKEMQFPENFWKVARNNYVTLAQLVGHIDENINELILLSFAINLYMICVQLFNSLNAARDDNEFENHCWKKVYNGVFTTTYFVFSFVFLISRFLAVSFTASCINTNSKIPLDTLFSVRSKTYCIEVQRFIKHITSDVVAFTGLKFFCITRGLILTIAGTVVTYELVLVQFNQPSPSVHANITVKDSCGGIGSIRT